MASLSINTFSVNSQQEFHNPKTLKQKIYNNVLKPYNLIDSQKPLSLNSNLQPLSELHMPPKPVHLSTRYSQLSILRKPNSICSPINCSFSPLKKLSTFCAEKVLILLVGSLVFIGCLATRPVIALPVQQKSSYSENMEERKGTQNGKSDDEKMYAKLLEGNPRNVEALKVVLNEKMRKGKTKEAVQYVERLIDVQPEEVEWRLLQALCYEMMGQLSKSKRLFKEILAQRPLLVRALHVWSLSHFPPSHFICCSFQNACIG